MDIVSTTKHLQRILLISCLLIAGFVYASGSHLSISDLGIKTSEDSLCRFDNRGPDPERDSTKNQDNHYRSSSDWNLGNWDGISDPRVFLVVAVGVAAVAAFIVSNDIDVHRSYSFIHPAPRYSDNFGLSFGLRKTFPHSALEYGGSFMQYTDFYGTYPNTLLNKQQVWGGHLNYVHQLFYKHSPERLRFYAGPSINCFKTVGYGGIAGVEFKVFDRLKMDLRYELTTQTNQLKAGFFFTYQKKSPWED
ncbi:MAG: hypothetical protein K0S33_3876 [Bacteroidetes bacterium]|jgi:hypothetical protein|nr:hypothetical protein [Bacteroidota bacterium]